MTYRERNRVDMHDLMKIAVGSGEWGGTRFRTVSLPYHKYHCVIICGKFSRKLCRCDKDLIFS